VRIQLLAGHGPGVEYPKVFDIPHELKPQ